MAKRGVYVVHYNGNDYQLTVVVDGATVPMEEFTETHVPVQVTGLTHLGYEKAQNFIGLLIAEEGPSLQE